MLALTEGSHELERLRDLAEGELTEVGQDGGLRELEVLLLGSQATHIELITGAKHKRSPHISEKMADGAQSEGQGTYLKSSSMVAFLTAFSSLLEFAKLLAATRATCYSRVS